MADGIVLDEFFDLPENIETEPVTPCEETDCKAAGVACFYPDNETENPNHWYCAEHAPKHGFCWGCGLFWGGCESFDFAKYRGGVQGLCEDCGDALKADFELDDDDDDYFYEN